MSAYLSNLLTHTTSRYNSLRRTLLSNEDDGDTDDDSHISRVLRAYYIEKGRPFPPWLPADPKDRRAQSQIQSQNAYGQPSQQAYYNNRQVSNIQGHASSNRSSLSDLWDPPSTPTSAQQPGAVQQPTSLRNLRRGAPSASQQPPPPQQRQPHQQQQQQLHQQHQQYQQGGPAPVSQYGETLGPRPMGAQRAGSYQSIASQHSARSMGADGGGAGVSGGAAAGVGGGGGTAQERLKARLWGGARGGTPPPHGQGGYAPPPSTDRYDGGSRGHR